MIALVVRFDLRDANAAARFDALTVQLVESVRAEEPGTLVYATHTVDGEPLARVFYEMYEDQAAKQAHEATEHVRAFLAERAELLAGRRVEFLSPSAAVGVPREED